MTALRHRGQPLAALGIVLAGWIGVRAALWEPPFDRPAPIKPPGAAVTVLATGGAPPSAGGQSATVPSPPLLALARPVPQDAARMRRSLAAAESSSPLAGGGREIMPLTFAPGSVPDAAMTPHVAAAPRFLDPAALAPPPLPPGLALPAARPSPEMPRALTSSPSPWSGDGWLLLRRGSTSLAAASGFPAYGASQVGGVIRFALAPSSANAPQAFVRVSRAIGGFDEREIAAGLSARPFANLPLRLLGEARVQRGSGGTRVRPAASLVTVLPPVRLPLEVAGEAYAQAGYAGAPIGDKRGATAFFDIQTVADRVLASAGPAELRLGAGAWSGGQKGAVRLDLGPRASVRLANGAAASRLALDWRFRVAGNARPASGPTLTFSAGF